MGKEFIYKLIPVNIRRINELNRLKDLDEWKEKDWLKMFESLCEYLNNSEDNSSTNNFSGNFKAVASKEESRELLIVKIENFIEDYIQNYNSSWHPLRPEVLATLLDDVKHSRESSKANMEMLIQFNHNIEDFDIRYDEIKEDIMIGNYFLGELLDENSIYPQLKNDIQNP
jgi:hypothetical protein